MITKFKTHVHHLDVNMLKKTGETVVMKNNVGNFTANSNKHGLLPPLGLKNFGIGFYNDENTQLGSDTQEEQSQTRVGIISPFSGVKEYSDNFPSSEHQRKIRENKKSTDILWAGKFRAFFASDWSVVGIKYVFKSGVFWFRRLIWLALVLFGFGFMAFQISNRVVYFISNPTTVDIRINYKTEIPFPTVTICNENMLSRTEAQSIPGFEQLITDLYPIFENPTKQPNFTVIRDFNHKIAAHNFTWETVYYLMSPFSWLRNLYACNYNSLSCDPTDYDLVATNMGYCLQFNTAGNRTSTRAGESFGLFLLLNASQDDYLFTKSRIAGFRVLLHAKDEIPLVFELGFQADVGKSTSAAMQLKTVTKLPKPYGNCSDIDGYSYNACMDSCLNEFIIEECDCRYLYYTKNDIQVCDPEMTAVCADTKKTEFISAGLSEERCHCPPQCFTDFYQYTLSSAKYSEFALLAVAELICESNQEYSNESSMCKDENTLSYYSDNIERDITEIQVYFDQLIHEDIQTKRAYPLLALLCDIGGAMGLILGSTVLTLFEVIDFSLVTLYDCIKLCVMKKQNRQKN